MTAPLISSGRGKQLSLLLLAMVVLTFLCGNVFAHGMSEAEKQAVIDGGNWRYLWLGATHMLSGYDHLAFVFGIIFFLTSFRDIAKYVTAFTIGHSITLIFATFNAIQINYFLIDAVIGLSVCYIAFANIDGFRKYLNVGTPNMMVMIVGLGLIHGFGLSTRLQQLPLSEDDLLMNIISFNIGVELGQISALAVMLIAIAALRNTHVFASFSLITNYLLILVGGFLFLMQMHGYEHETNDELMAAAAMPVSAARPMQQPEEWTDTLDIVIPARGDREYKILVEEGGTFFYDWQTNGEELYFDFHAEPSNDSSGYFRSFDKDTSGDAAGALTATFTGTHGWYWKNKTGDPVSIRLRLGGDYTMKDSGPQIVPSQPEEETPVSHHDSL